MREKWLKPAEVGTYKGLLMYAMKMRRSYLNKIRVLTRRINRQAGIIQKSDKIIERFYRTSEIEIKMSSFILDEIRGRGFNVNVIMREAQRKLIEWMKTDEYKKITTTVIRSK